MWGGIKHMIFFLNCCPFEIVNNVEEICETFVLQLIEYICNLQFLTILKGNWKDWGLQMCSLFKDIISLLFIVAILNLTNSKTCLDIKARFKLV